MFSACTLSGWGIEIGSAEAAAFTADYVSGTLPVVYINTVDATPVVDKENKIDAQMWVEIPENYTGDLEAVASADEPLELTIKGRGNSSWFGTEKKLYKLKLDSKTALLGMPKSKHWALLGLALEFPAQFLNTAGFAIAEELGMPWTPRYRHVEVVLNNEYIGLYALTESIKIDSNRVDIYEQPEENDDPATIPYGWLIEIDNYVDEDQVVVPEFKGQMMRVTHKSPEVLSYEQTWWLIGEFSRLNYLIYSDNPAKAETWADYIDAESAVKYFIVRELLHDYDGYNGSMYLYRDAPDEDTPEPRWTMGPLWDLSFPGHTEKDDWAYNDPARYGEVHWFQALTRTDIFKSTFAGVWAKFYPHGIEKVIDVIRAEGDLCAAAEKANRLRWPKISDKTADKIRVLTTMMEHHSQWIDDNIGRLGEQSGIFDPLTGESLSIEVEDDAMVFTAEAPTPVQVFNTTGQQVAKFIVQGQYSLSLPAGMYIVATPQGSQKILF